MPACNRGQQWDGSTCTDCPPSTYQDVVPMNLMEPCKMCSDFRNDTGHDITGAVDPAMCSKFALDLHCKGLYAA